MRKATDFLPNSIATAVVYQRLLDRPQPAEIAGCPIHRLIGYFELLWLC